MELMEDYIGYLCERRVIFMLTIDEAIKLEIQIAKDQTDHIATFEHAQIANWLVELKALKENSISKEAFEKMKTRAYKKGIDKDMQRLLMILKIKQ